MNTLVQPPSSTARARDLLPLQTFEQAVALHAHGRLWEAAQLYEVVLKANDRHYDAVYRLGLVRLQQGKFGDARQLFRRAVKIDKSAAEAHFHLGVALVGLTQFEDAVQRYRKALALKPRFAEAHNNLGHALQLLGRHQEAALSYEAALAIQPAYAEARNNLGNALQMLGRSEEALAQYEKALVARPNYAEAHNNLGNVLAKRNRHREAIAHYEAALAISPKYAEAHLSLGNSLGMLGQYDRALGHYRTANALRPEYVEAHVALSNALGALGRPEEALAHCNEALALSPGHAAAVVARANVLVRMGQDSAAADLLENLLARGVRSATVLLALAQLPASAIKIDLLSELDKTLRQEGGTDADFGNLIAFARAAALDRAGRHAEAWEQLASTNRIVFVANQEQYLQACDREQASLARLEKGRSEPRLISTDCGPTTSLLILGPSRSGKTLLERLVSTLEGVKAGYENSTVEDALRRTSRAAGETRLEDLLPALYREFREAYRGELAGRAASGRVFTNTNPGYIHHADLLVETVPEVRVVLIKRNLDDNVLRIYQRQYNSGNFYAYDLAAAYAHVTWYHRMMDLLGGRFPEIVRILDYEEMIADPRAALRLAAELCGLRYNATPLPAVGDDRGCAAPYRRFMAAELEHRRGPS
jgi:tetratricopeptide (TPR) repeat protein